MLFFYRKMVNLYVNSEDLSFLMSTYHDLRFLPQEIKMRQQNKRFFTLGKSLILKCSKCSFTVSKIILKLKLFSPSLSMFAGSFMDHVSPPTTLNPFNVTLQVNMFINI